MPLRFRKSLRLRRPAEFEAARRMGERASSGPIAINWLRGDKNSSDAPDARRLGLVVPSGVGKAVERNRIKRVVRELFRIEHDMFPPGDTVVIARPGSAGLKNEEIRQHVRAALARIAGRQPRKGSGR